MNNTTVVATATGLSSTNTHYIVNGSLSIVGNILIVIVVISKPQTLKRSAFLFSLAVGDIINGFALMVSAVLRTKYQLLSERQSLVSPTYCMLTITPFWIIGNQGTSLVLLLIGIERFVAVQYFAWYRISWTKKLSWISVSLVLMFCLFSIGVAYYIASTTMTMTSINCYFISVVGKTYNFYNYSVSILAGFISNVCTLLSLISCLIKMNRFRKYPNNSTSVPTIQGHIKKQWSLSKSMIAVTLCDFSLVVIPNILMFVISSFKVNAAAYGLQYVSSISPTLLCVKGALNIFCCLLFNPEFRRNALRLAKVKKTGGIVPITITVNHSRQVKKSSNWDNVESKNNTFI